MRVLLLILTLPLVAACSTMGRPASPSAASTEVSEPSGQDIAGRWRGNWTGTGLFQAPREDAITLEVVQRGNVGFGRLVLEGTNAAESVPEGIRRAGLWGTRVFAEISPGRVTLRDQVDGGRLFTADLKLDGNGDQMYGFVRGSRPNVGLVLTREQPRKTGPEAPAAPPQSAMAVPMPGKAEPQPQVIAMVPEPKPEATRETKDAAAPAQRLRQEEFVAVQELTAIHFDFDKAELRPEAVDQIVAYAGWLKDHDDTVVMIEGHCDERGTAEYNVALGERRARSVRDRLSVNGITPDRISTVSYGKERLACAAPDTAECHEMNRRTEFRIKSR
jgi:peptidoglycan-associated lipoprotein